MSKKKIKVALAGIGNCASSLVQGLSFYSNADFNNRMVGLAYPDFGGYKISDIEFVVAFDVDSRKVGTDLSKAIFAKPNCTKKFVDVKSLNVKVLRGPVLDGIAPHMKEYFIIDKSDRSCDVSQILISTKADMLICYLPVGSADASRFYAEQAIKAGVGFINAIPEFICSNKEWILRFKEKGLPCAGDDIKSQVGATILHRTLVELIYNRGQVIDNTYQLNIGGNTDFLNMKNESRIVSKRKSKTQAVTSIVKDNKFDVKIGPSDYIPYLKDNKICYINIKGRQFGDIPFEIDLKLSVEDSPNSAGIMVDVIRAMKIALNRGISGNLEAISSYAFKSPSVQYCDNVAKRKVDEFISGN